MKLAAADAASKTSTASRDFDKFLMLDGIDTGGMILPKGWDVDMKGVRHLQVLDGIPYVKAAFSAPVFITRRLTNIDKEEIRLELAFYCDHHWKKLIAPRGDLMDKGKIVKYANQGLPVTSETSKEAVQYIEAFETINRDNLPTHRRIERMGWIDSKEFFPYHMDSIAVYDGANDESHRIISAVVPHGDKEKWLEMGAKLRTMHAARVMLAASFASVLLYPLQQRPFILHLWANSRSGKTAVLKAAISIYAALLSFADYISSKAVFGADEQEASGSAWELGVNLLEALKKDAKYDAVERAWAAVNEWVVSNKDHFEVKHGDMPGNNYCAEHEPIYGRYVPKAEKLYILPGALSRMLTDNGFSPEKSVKGFKERGYISGKQEQQRVGKGSVKVIIANIRLDYTQYDPPLFE